jgi:gamma-glutamylcyclotransferase (GGCT)/AIG2-like uncharacterized protein YtfP
MHLYVYGTLKTGFALNGYLKDQKFIGEATTVPGYILYDLGWFPGMKKKGNQSVRGELWEVDNFDRLDMVEGSAFQRESIKLQFPYENIDAQTYLYIGREKNCTTSLFWEKNV